MKRHGRSKETKITTTNGKRAALWDHLFGTDVLPVFHSRPRYQEVPGRGSRLAYDLNLGALHHPFARERLAAHVSQRTRRDYVLVLNEIRTAVCWPIDAVDCVTVDPEKERPFSFLYSHSNMGTHAPTQAQRGNGIYA